MKPTHLDPALLQAYRETDYHVNGASPFVLRIGERSARLLALHAAHGVSASAFVTACNPRSRSLADDENARRHAALRERLRAEGYAFVEGLGRHPTNGWPGETSVLVLGLARAAAHRLGQDLEQNAVVAIAADGVPELLVVDLGSLPIRKEHP